MSNTVIDVRNVNKLYKLGYISARTLTDDIQLWWAKMRNQPNPLLKVGTEAGKNEVGDYIFALKNLNLTITEGDVLGIIGPNGAGKSTLLKLLSQITLPTTGEIRTKGRLGSLLEVGTGFHGELTGRENVKINGSILGMTQKEISKKFDEIVEFAGVETYIDTPVKRYSSGMRVRLGFAVAAFLDPEILIVDEVLAVGDVAFQRRCLERMGEIGREGRTVLFVSHNMDAIRKLCKSSVVLLNGEKIFEGDVDTGISKYIEALTNEYGSAKPEILLPEKNVYTDKLNWGRCTKLAFSAVDGESRTEFRLLEKWKITVEFVLERKLDGVFVGLKISTLEGFWVTTLFSKKADLEKGTYKVDLIFDHPISANELTFGIGLGSDLGNFYYAEDGRVSVLEVTDGEQPLRPEGFGILISEQIAEIQTC